MNPTALVFLDEPIARKLAVAWVVCRGSEREWLETAGIQSSLQAQRTMKALRINGICRVDGVTDDAALAYIRAILAKPLQGRRGNGKR